MHIEHLELKNYAGFADFSLDFPKGNLAVFIGENGSGKTSILSAIWELFKPYEKDRIENEADFNKKNFDENKYHKNSNNEIAVPLDINIQVKNPLGSVFSWQITNGDITHESFFSLKYRNWQSIQIDKLYKSASNKNQRILYYIPVFFDNEIHNFSIWYRNLYWYDAHMTKKFQKDYLPKVAIDRAIFEFSGLKIETVLGETIQELDVFFTKNNIQLQFLHLSEGERKTIGIISSIINFFTPILSEKNDNILDFQGIVLIDEIETHLHPRWQREILPNLTKTFPNVQFIVTTHSPQVISSVPKEAIFLLKDFQAIPIQAFTQGRDTNSLLTEVFDIPIRPVEDMKMLAHFYAAIGEEEVIEAEKILAKMTERWGDLDSEVIKARMDFEELLNEKVLE